MSIENLNLSHQSRSDIETLWNFHFIDNSPATADFLLVLGSHDMRVADRAADLFLSKHSASLVVITGGAGKVTQAKWAQPEAEIYAERLKEAGVPAKAIITEIKAANTGDNFEFSKKLLADLDVQVSSGIVVCKPYMARRSLAVALKRWPEVEWRTCPPQIKLWEYPTEDVPLNRMINLMVGDLQRLKVYAERGFQAPVDVPESVWTAYERLVALGFDEFVIR